MKASVMAEQVMKSVAKPNNLNSILGNDMLKGENGLLQIVT